MEAVLTFILYYIIPVLSISVPIITIIDTFIHHNDKEYTEVSYFIYRKDDNDAIKNKTNKYGKFCNF